MDETYWIPARRADEDSEGAVEPSIRPVKTSTSAPPAAPSAKPVPVRIAPEKPSTDVREQVVSAIHSGNYNDALSLCYEPGSSATPAKVEAAAQPLAPEAAAAEIAKEAAPPAASTAPAPPAKAASKTKRRGRDRKSRWVETAVATSAATKAQTVAAEKPQLAGSSEPAVRKAVEPSNGAGGRELAATSPAEIAEEESVEPTPATETEEPFASLTGAAASRKPVIAWAAAAAFIVLAAIIFGVIYHFHSSSSGKTGETVSAASPNANTAGDSGAPAPNALLDQAGGGGGAGQDPSQRGALRPRNPGKR